MSKFGQTFYLLQHQLIMLYKVFIDAIMIQFIYLINTNVSVFPTYFISIHVTLIYLFAFISNFKPCSGLE